jgi:hypothetical protein
MPDDVKLHQPRSWADVSGIAAFVLMVVVGLALVYVVLDSRSAGRGAARQEESVAACERGNLLRGYLLLRQRQLPQSPAGALAPRILTLPNCYETTHHHGETKLLSREQTEAYLRVLATGHAPIVSEQGRVVGDRPLPGDPGGT